jgi:hypothetical protein
MRKLTALAILLVPALPSVVRAAPPACKDLLRDWQAQVKMIDDANSKAASDAMKAGKKPPAPNTMIPDLPFDPNDGHLECVKDGVVMLNGDANNLTHAPVKPPMGAMATVPPAPVMWVPCTDPTADMANCQVDYAAAVKHAIDLVGPTVQYDEIVVFGQQMAPSSNPPAPLFFRDGLTASAPDMTTGAVTGGGMGVNDVAGIGLGAKVPRVMGHPYVGYVAAGSTGQGSKFAAIGGSSIIAKFQKEDMTGPIAAFSACGKAPKNPTDPPSDQPNPAICFPSFYNYFDALAQASGAIYGPYLKSYVYVPDPMKAGSVIPQVVTTPGMIDPMTMMMTPPTMTTPVVPLGVDEVIGGSSSAKSGWLMDVLSLDPMTKMPIIDPMTMKPKTKKSPTALYYLAQPRIWNSFMDTQGSIFAGNTFRDDANGTFETTKPPAMYGINIPFTAGWKAGTVLSGSQVLRFTALDLYTMGLMAAGDLPATIRSFQQVTIADLYKDGRTPLPTSFDAKSGPQMGLRTALVLRPNSKDITAIPTASIITASGGPRDPAFEAAPHSHKQLWVVVSAPQGVTEAPPSTPPATPDPYDALKKRVLGLQHLDVVANWRHQFAAYYYMLTQYRGRVVNTVDGVDDNAYWEFGLPTDDQADFQVDGGVMANFTGVVPVSPNSPELKSVVSFSSVPGGAGITYVGQKNMLRIVGDQTASRVPPNSVSVRMRLPVGGPKLAGAALSFDGGPSIRIPAKPANLIPDGQWHTYTALVSGNADFTGGMFQKFSFSPIDSAWDNHGTGDNIEVEFIRVANVPSTKDSDTDCGGKAKPDGWIDSEDNCPNVYNPLQEDGNGDGVGDACEDYDGDGVVNACDNCPTVTNSRQRDSDGNGTGDVCDGPQKTPCFLAPGSLGGPVSSAPGALFGVVFAGVVGLLAFRRRRSR